MRRFAECPNTTVSSESAQATPTTSTRRVTTNLSHALNLVANQDCPNATIPSESAQATPTPSTRRVTTNLSHPLHSLVANEDDEEALVNQYAIEGAAAEEVLGYDEDDEEEEGDVAGDYRDGGDGGPDFDFKAFQRQVRVDETRRAEGNRRAGGVKTQRAMVKAWEVGELTVNYLNMLK